MNVHDPRRRSRRRDGNPPLWQVMAMWTAVVGVAAAACVAYVYFWRL